MVRVVIGDMFKSSAQTLVNTVNCVGIMGKGVALEFKKRFPDMYDDYVRRCRLGEVRLGRAYLYKYLTPPWILNFPTKEHWRSVARLHDIVRGLLHLEHHYKERGEQRVACLLENLGLNERPGRPGFEDLVVAPVPPLQPDVPLVVEVKSGKRVGPNLDDLRQLDDWVFDLSGEEGARKHGLGSGKAPHVARGTSLFNTPSGAPYLHWSYHHPKPHKGVFHYSLIFVSQNTTGDRIVKDIFRKYR